jgi:hypothetical protein
MNDLPIPLPLSPSTPRRAGRWCALAVVLMLACCSTGCMRAWLHGDDDAAPQMIENPLFVPAMDREFLWNQTVDSVDDFFRIEREERVRLIAGVLTEGRIDTFPVTGSTILEPWRTDSTPGYEKWHATLQSIRRRATVRVIPTDGGYLMDVAVQKELEDLDKPEHATAGGATLRYDGTLVRQEGAPGRYSVTLGWIPIGRDIALEQRLLADIQGRLAVGHKLGHLPPVEEGEIASPSDLEALPPATPQREERLDLSPPENLPPPVERLPGL